MAKNDLNGRAEQLAERCAGLLKALPQGSSRDPDHKDGPWRNWYEDRPDGMIADLKSCIHYYLGAQKRSREPDDGPRRRKDRKDMRWFILLVALLLDPAAVLLLIAGTCRPHD